MKKIFHIAFFFLSVSAFAQKQAKVDSVYFLLDTAKIPKNENMWEVEIEGPYNHFRIKCPCLQYNTNPTFIHKIGDAGKPVTSEKLALYKFENIANLISMVKKFVENDFKGSAFFLLEPRKGEYVIHRVMVAPPRKPEIIN